MNRRTISLSIRLLALVMGTALAQAAQPGDAVPRFTHPRIDDAANILAPFEPRIARMADAFSTDLGIDVHVVTSVDGRTPIENQAVAAFQKRQVSRSSPTGGLLIILDPKLGSARIEVGYALEGVMTDLHMSRVARDQLAPYVSYGNAGMAVMDVVHYLRDFALLAAVPAHVPRSRQFPLTRTRKSRSRPTSARSTHPGKRRRTPWTRCCASCATWRAIQPWNCSPKARA
jgi:uncharacterized membrane protein YgcG